MRTCQFIICRLYVKKLPMVCQSLKFIFVVLVILSAFIKMNIIIETSLELYSMLYIHCL